MIRVGLDRLIAAPKSLEGRRYGLLAHGASVTSECVPAHLALAAAGQPPAALFAPEHGYHGVEQDMVPTDDARDPWSGAPVHSLYGANEGTLRPRREALEGLDLLVVDLQDIGARYYTYAATAVWAIEAALEAGLETWVLDRPNPLGGEIVEGPALGAGFESFVGAFRMPVRHGLTLGEIVRLEGARRGFDSDRIRVVTMEGWRRPMLWPDTGRPWIAPSPNVPGFATALLYPGLCLIEATELSEGRGTTRPFHLVGAPWIEPPALARRLTERAATAGGLGVRFVPTYFRPQFQKYRGEVCGGIEIVVVDPHRVRGFRLGVEIVRALAELGKERFRWRQAPYEFVGDRPAIDLLTGGSELRIALVRGKGLGEWIVGWSAAERDFYEERRSVLLYPEESLR